MHDTIEYRGIGITNRSVKTNIKSGKLYNDKKYTQLSSKSSPVLIQKLCI